MSLNYNQNRMLKEELKCNDGSCMSGIDHSLVDEVRKYITGANVHPKLQCLHDSCKLVAMATARERVKQGHGPVGLRGDQVKL